MNLSVNGVCSVTRERHFVLVTFISKDCRESENYYRKSWEMLCMNWKGLLLKKASWPWRKLFFSEVLALHSVEVTRSIPDCMLHDSFWCYLGSLGENNHYFTLKQLTTALRTWFLCHQRYSSLVFWLVCTVWKSASYFRRVRPSVLPDVSTRRPLDGFPWNLVLGTFFDNMSGKLKLINTGAKCLALYLKTYVDFIVVDVITSS